eukprot:scaffold1616_cov310-Pinguiococcus_pyrenoidosus.AAC.34
MAELLKRGRAAHLWSFQHPLFLLSPGQDALDRVIESARPRLDALSIGLEGIILFRRHDVSEDDSLGVGLVQEVLQMSAPPLCDLRSRALSQLVVNVVSNPPKHVVVPTLVHLALLAQLAHVQELYVLVHLVHQLLAFPNSRLQALEAPLSLSGALLQQLPHLRCGLLLVLLEPRPCQGIFPLRLAGVLGAAGPPCSQEDVRTQRPLQRPFQKMPTRPSPNATLSSPTQHPRVPVATEGISSGPLRKRRKGGEVGLTWNILIHCRFVLVSVAQPRAQALGQALVEDSHHTRHAAQGVREGCGVSQLSCGVPLDTILEM